MSTNLVGTPYGSATTSATPSVLAPAAALARRLDVYDDSGYAPAELAGRAPCKLVVLSDRLSQLVEHFERPIRLVRLIATIASIAVAGWLLAHHWNTSLLTNLK